MYWGERERIEAMKGKICLGHINNGRKGPGLFFERGRLQKSEDDLEFSSPFRWDLLREIEKKGRIVSRKKCLPRFQIGCRGPLYLPR